MPSDPAQSSAEMENGKTKPTLSYTLGQTPEQQKRVILIGAVLWGCVVLLVLKSYMFGV